jgi:uncharacterized protein YecE (DUF72 family)
MGIVRVGTAGWSIPTSDSAAFPADGTSLERYAARLGCAEINSSFHRPHRRSTYERWAASVPEQFRFSVKLPKTVTHQRKLVDCSDLVSTFLEEAGGLGGKLEVILVQLPPSLAFDHALARGFFPLLGRVAAIACEPRHPSWFEDAADALLSELKVARVAADPARVEAAARPGGWAGLAYYRLHGSPVIYRSSYEPERLDDYAVAMAGKVGAARDTWCIFDNTASSAAIGNALDLMRRLNTGPLSI